MAVYEGTSPRFGCYFFGVRFASHGPTVRRTRRFRGFTRGHRLCWRCASLLDRGLGCWELARAVDSVDFGFWGTESGGVDAGRLIWI